VRDIARARQGVCCVERAREQCNTVHEVRISISSASSTKYYTLYCMVYRTCGSLQPWPTGLAGRSANDAPLPWGA
jgi:hypothetical protein